MKANTKMMTTSLPSADGSGKTPANNPAAQKRRKLGLEGIKLLLGTAAMAGTVAFWSVFSNQDRLALANKFDPNAATASSSAELSLLLPPLPTLVPFDLGNTPSEGVAIAPVAVQDLRTVTMPAAQSNNGAPVVVGGTRSNSGPVTTTRSS